jgi:hypothetical protein
MASVFQKTGYTESLAAVADPSQLITPANLSGQTAHFAVYVDPALGPDGARDARGVVARCEADYGAVGDYFSGIDAGPFTVVLFSNPSGAYHMSCAATDLFCDARTGPADPDFSEFLNVAEFVEVFEAMQAGGWDCGRSNGEGLSRVLAADAYPSELNGFATAAIWLDSSRRNFVDQSLDSDTDSTANGCSVLFLNWLRFQLGYSWRQVVSAAAPTLADSYRTLTGKSDGFSQFESQLNARFPQGQPSGLTTDNPFPI